MDDELVPKPGAPAPQVFVNFKSILVIRCYYCFLEFFMVCRCSCCFDLIVICLSCIRVRNKIEKKHKKQNKNVLCYLFTLLTNEFVFLLSSSSFLLLLVHRITETNRHSTNGGEAQSPPNVSGFRLFVTIYSNNKNVSLLRRLKEE